MHSCKNTHTNTHWAGSRTPTSFNNSTDLLSTQENYSEGKRTHLPSEKVPSLLWEYCGFLGGFFCWMLTRTWNCSDAETQLTTQRWATLQRRRNQQHMQYSRSASHGPGCTMFALSPRCTVTISTLGFNHHAGKSRQTEHKVCGKMQRPAIRCHYQCCIVIK